MSKEEFMTPLMFCMH